MLLLDGHGGASSLLKIYSLKFLNAPEKNNKNLETMKTMWEGINYTTNTYLHNLSIYIHVYVNLHMKVFHQHHH